MCILHKEKTCKMVISLSFLEQINSFCILLDDVPMKSARYNHKKNEKWKISLKKCKIDDEKKIDVHFYFSKMFFFLYKNQINKTGENKRLLNNRTLKLNLKIVVLKI